MANLEMRKGMLVSLLIGGWLSLCSLVAHAAPEVGWWWNPAESGRGFFIESQNGITFLGAYFYDTDGRATWLVAGGQNADPYNYTGPLYAVSGGQTLFGTYVAPQGSTIVGTVSVHFSDDNHATLTWPGGTIALERQIFDEGAGDATFQPQSGWWWNPAESGRGYSVEVQGNHLFVVAFMYNEAGKPVWYYSAGPLSTPTHYEGQWLQFAGGQTMGGPYRPPAAPTTVGKLILDFTSTTEADATFTDDLVAGRAVAKRQTRQTKLQREFKSPVFHPPIKFIGSFSLKVKSIHEDSGDTDEATSTVSDFGVFWGITSDSLQRTDGGANYSLSIPESLPFSVHVDARSLGADGTNCTGSEDRDYLIPTNSSKLSVDGFGYFYGNIDFGPVVYAVTLECTLVDGTMESRPLLEVIPTKLMFKGSIENDVAKGTTSFTSPEDPGVTGTIEYSFRASR